MCFMAASYFVTYHSENIFKGTDLIELTIFADVLRLFLCETAFFFLSGNGEEYNDL